MKFPIQKCRIKFQPESRFDVIESQISSVYPIIHEKILFLYINFLHHKKHYGTNLEKQFYTKMTLIQFVHRLLAKRCVVFMNESDDYLLMNGESGFGGFEKVGHAKSLHDFLTYDEIKLSALMSVSSYTEFLNSGSRTNVGFNERDKTKIEINGIIIGMIGARFEREGVMEYQVSDL